MKPVLKNAPKLVLYLAALTLAVSFVRGQFAGLRAQGDSVGEYTLVLAEVTTNKAGTTRLGSLQTLARRADGATVIRLGPEGDGGRMLRLASGMVIETDDTLRRKSTVQGPTESEPVDPANACKGAAGEGKRLVGEELLGPHRVARFVSIGTERPTTTLLALDHQCARVGYLVDFGGGEKSETRLVTLVPGRPSDLLFDTNGYTEGPPSALHEHSASANCGPECEARHQRRDAEYLKRRPQ